MDLSGLNITGKGNSYHFVKSKICSEQKNQILLYKA